MDLKRQLKYAHMYEKKDEYESINLALANIIVN